MATTTPKSLAALPALMRVSRFPPWPLRTIILRTPFLLRLLKMSKYNLSRVSGAIAMLPG
jgi:hypothetical protein